MSAGSRTARDEEKDGTWKRAGRLEPASLRRAEPCGPCRAVWAVLCRAEPCCAELTHFPRGNAVPPFGKPQMWDARL